MPGTLGWIIVIVILAGGLWYLKKHTHVLDKFFPGSTPAAGGLSTQDAGTVGYALGRIENCVPVCQAKGNSSSECQKCVDSMLK